MRTSRYRYPVKLSEEQRRWLETMLHMSSTPAKHYLVAWVLHKIYQGNVLKTFR